MTQQRIQSLFDKSSFVLVGMVHLSPLPGAPDYQDRMEVVLQTAVDDARSLTEAGFEALLVENFNDAPFYPDSAPAETIAAMALAVDAVRREAGLPVGVNVLRCDARAALGIAATTQASFVRLNVHTWPVVTDQGTLEGRAYETVREREKLCPDTALWVDVGVKHGRSLAPSLEQEAADNVKRGAAEALLVSGSATGAAADSQELATLAKLELGVPLLVGSGVTAENLADYLPYANGAVVGSSLKKNGRVSAPVDPLRAKALVKTRDSLVKS